MLFLCFLPRSYAIYPSSHQWTLDSSGVWSVCTITLRPFPPPCLAYILKPGTATYHLSSNSHHVHPVNAAASHTHPFLSQYIVNNTTSIVQLCRIAPIGCLVALTFSWSSRQDDDLTQKSPSLRLPVHLSLPLALSSRNGAATCTLSLLKLRNTLTYYHSPQCFSWLSVQPSISLKWAFLRLLNECTVGGELFPVGGSIVRRLEKQRLESCSLVRAVGVSGVLKGFRRCFTWAVVCRWWFYHPVWHASILCRGFPRRMSDELCLE